MNTSTPWNIEKDKNAFYITHESGELRSHIAKIEIDNLCPEHGDALENAKLIAASPDILAALIKAEQAITAMCRYMEQSMPNGPEAGTFERENPTLQMVRAAIQKATA